MDKVLNKRQIIHSTQKNGFSTLGFAMTLSAVLAAAGMLMHQINNQRTKTVYEGLNKHQILKGVENDAREWAALLQIAFKAAPTVADKNAVLATYGCWPEVTRTWTKSATETLEMTCKRSSPPVFTDLISYVISSEKEVRNVKYRGRVLLSFPEF